MVDFYKKKRKISVPPMELVTPQTNYALTVNLRVPNGKTLEYLWKIYVRWFYNNFKGTNFKVYPELSCVGKLHFHGTVSFKSYEDIFKFYLSIQNMTAACMEIDSINDIDIWKQYYKKQKVYWMYFPHRYIKSFKTIESV